MLIKPDNPLLQYSGRIDWTDKTAPVFVYPCSYIKIIFSGTRVAAVVENHKSYWSSYLGFFIDGEQKCVKLSDTGRETVLLADGLTDAEHELMLFKRMDSCHTFTFYGFEVDDSAVLREVEPKPERRIEVYGDSVSAGEVSEAVDCVGQPDPEHDGEYSNSYYSYTWMTARNLNAEIHDIAQGGAALLDGTGWFAGPDFVGMESIYDKIQYYPEPEKPSKWDFQLYRPHVVIVAIGQNDANPDNYMAEDYEGEKAQHWRKSYRDFIAKLRVIYPKATIILATTILEHDANWDKAIDEVCRELADERIHHFLYSNNGAGTPGHIRIPEAEKMSEELTAFIESLGEEIWE
ncbi:MAG: electron transporter RnfD [Lachnospiraceae bacterium]|nr:electron transporter RnfD [Lachnospiraceae bacterium]